MGAEGVSELAASHVLPVINHTRAWDIAKFLLRLSSLFTSLILVIISIVQGALRSSRANDSGIACPPAVIAVCWDAAHLIPKFIRGRNIRPITVLVVDVVIGGGAAICVGVLAWVIQTHTNSWSHSQDYKQDVRIEVPLTVFMSILSVSHFTLVIRYCVEVDRQNKASRCGVDPTIEARTSIDELSKGAELEVNTSSVQRPEEQTAVGNLAEAEGTTRRDNATPVELHQTPMLLELGHNPATSRLAELPAEKPNLEISQPVETRQILGEAS